MNWLPPFRTGLSEAFTNMIIACYPIFGKLFFTINILNFFKLSVTSIDERTAKV